MNFVDNICAVRQTITQRSERQIPAGGVFVKGNDGVYFCHRIGIEQYQISRRLAPPDKIGFQNVPPDNGV